MALLTTLICVLFAGKACVTFFAGCGLHAADWLHTTSVMSMCDQQKAHAYM